MTIDIVSFVTCLDRLNIQLEGIDDISCTIAEKVVTVLTIKQNPPIPHVVKSDSGLSFCFIPTKLLYVNLKKEIHRHQINGHIIK